MTAATIPSDSNPVWTVNGRFAAQELTGVQRYAQEILRAMDNILTQENKILRQLRLQLIVPPGAQYIPDMSYVSVRETRFGSGHLWDQLVLPWYERAGILSLGNSGPILSRRHIVCIHDANTFIAPESYSRTFGTFYRTLLPLIGRQACRVATVSKFSADMLVKYGICAREKILVVYNGHEHALRWNASRVDPRRVNLTTRRYVLLLGSQAKHKNTEVVLSGASALDAAGIDIVVVGGASGIFSGGVHGVSGRNIHYAGYASDDELAAFFENALCFAFPSKTEGFGTPPLEAMVCGCPVISADTASLPEVGGKAVLYADPDKPAEWIDRILSLASSEELRAELIEKGRQRAKMFSWNEGARQYIDELLRLSSMSGDSSSSAS
jgi:glycosyltransferase involved in cell wall biosynthesis